jgi:hypothetical protein
MVCFKPHGSKSHGTRYEDIGGQLLTKYEFNYLLNMN